MLDQYLNAKNSEIEEFNKHLSNQSRYNKRRLTNIGTFRAYVEFYLRQHKGIAQNQTIIVRQLQPTSQGLPLEIYAFTNTLHGFLYEAIQSDIFDHLIAILPEFGLRVYQAPSRVMICKRLTAEIHPSCFKLCRTAHKLFESPRRGFLLILITENYPANQIF